MWRNDTTISDGVRPRDGRTAQYRAVDSAAYEEIQPFRAGAHRTCARQWAGSNGQILRGHELRVQDRGLVLRNISGQEFWLPLLGPLAVASLALVRDREGTALGAELRGADEQVRAVLP